MLSQDARQKLATVIGNLMHRSIEEARKVPYVLPQDEIIDILVRDPEKFASLVHAEQAASAQYSTGTLTAQMDAIAELAQLTVLDRFDMSFGEKNRSDDDLKPAVDAIHQLTRDLAVYVGNTVTLFEKEFERFADKFRQSLQQSGQALIQVGMHPEDMHWIEEGAESYFDSGEYLQAFLYDRLLSIRVITREMVSVPPGYSLAEKLLARGLPRTDSLWPLMRFVLRAKYVSQEAWGDLFDVLARLTRGASQQRYLLIDAIERDAIFCCNLLCDSFTNLKRLSPADLRVAVGKALEARTPRAGSRPV